MKQPEFEIYCDFDGTVTQQDVVNLLLDKLADSQWQNIETKWLEGKIGSRECLAEQIPLIQGGWEAIEDILNHEVKLEPDFKSFSNWCSTKNLPLHIVSDGLDKVINTVFSKQDISVTSIWSNKLEITKNAKTSIKFPYPPQNTECRSGLCKCQVLEKSKRKTIKVVIGDGLNDICWAQKADLIFAKSRLMDYCKNNNLPFHEFKSFTQITSHLENLFNLEESLEKNKKQNMQPAVLLIHGLTGTPKEMKPIAKHLENLGYHVESPMLAGHGLGHKEMIAATWKDWLKSARLSLNNLTNKFDDVYIVTLSVGGLIGTLLAKENPKVKGLILLSLAYGTPSKGTPKLKCLLPLVFKFPFLRKRLFWTEGPPYGIKNKRIQKSIERIMKVSNNGETTEHGFYRTYVESLYQHKLLENEVRKHSVNVSCPTLIIHSLEDTMLSPQNAASIYQDLGTVNKSIKFITGCDHIMTVDLQRDEVAKEIESFIKKTTGNNDEYPISFQDDLTCEIIPQIKANIKLDSFGKISSILNDINCDFKYHSIVIKKGETLILELPLIQTKFNLGALLPNPLKSISDSLTKVFPEITTIQFLGIVLPNTMTKDFQGLHNSSAWELAFQSLNALASSTKVLSLSNLNTEKEKTFLIDKLTEFKPLQANTFIRKGNYLLSFLFKVLNRRI